MPFPKTKKPKFRPGDRVQVHSRIIPRKYRDRIGTVLSVWDDRVMTLQMNDSLETFDVATDELSRNRIIK